MIPKDHPRYESLMLRARIVDAYKKGILADSGMIAHGRGEAFDYLIGEKTTEPARKAERAGAAALLLAENPVISVNGNTTALAAEWVVKLAEALGAKVEINLFYRTASRVEKVGEALKAAGAKVVLGVENEEKGIIEGLEGPRARASLEGVCSADVVLVPLEDGDRAEALVANGKTVVTVDLNPLSRTATTSTVTIVDNVVRALPNLIQEVMELKNCSENELKGILEDFSNDKNLEESLEIVSRAYTGDV
ncbi:4-phosphopantoate--beta-alanine ligase [Methanobacterium congolense]|uniref:4-phosphopantoate--beta-alanine ligase n=1 Tax=Methanobacterium congolense TaxID=118062 RepID=A0A1D3L2F2_9EURY|nr:4-phosphopantoate--beta-alanine ligase [Methanobacterium congolense]SCG85640.1 putative pantothenate synthetase [Methanobacterium congolense]